MTVYQAEWCPFSRQLRQRLTELGVEWLGGDTEDIIAELDERIPEPPTAEGHKLAAAMH
jgi:hypothetical protein